MLSQYQGHSAIGRILCQWKIPMTPGGIEPSTIRFMTQHFNHYTTAVPPSSTYSLQTQRVILATDCIQWHTHTHGRTTLAEGSVRRRGLYLTIHNTHNRQVSMPPAGFEPAIPASERPQTHVLDRAATRRGFLHILWVILSPYFSSFSFTAPLTN